MRIQVRREVHIAAPASAVWEYVTDWPRQAEWIPLTKVETLDSADRVGGRIRAWTGVGPVGFWDPMTITAWEQAPDGSGRCEVLHTGAVVRGEGVFAVRPQGSSAATLTWWERVAVPGGTLGGLLGGLFWKAVSPLAMMFADRSLRKLARRVEELHGDR
jgi:carbon monoxide dehydrogenase subunit G